MDSMSDSGDFQEVESNHSGRLSHVPNQPEVIPSCRAAAGACRLVHGMHLGYTKTFVVISFLHLIRTKIRLKEFFIVRTPRETESVPRAIRTGTSFTRDEEQHRSTIPMPRFARRPSAMSSLILVEIPQNSLVGQQISELPTPQSFCVGK